MNKRRSPREGKDKLIQGELKGLRELNIKRVRFLERLDRKKVRNEE